MEAIEQFGAAAFQFGGHYLPGIAYQRQAPLQAIDQPTVEVIHGEVLLLARVQSARRIV
ncbi:hypothetical protein D3C81_2125670 [compost metagenome]